MSFVLSLRGLYELANLRDILSIFGLNVTPLTYSFSLVFTADDTASFLLYYHSDIEFKNCFLFLLFVVYYFDISLGVNFGVDLIISSYLSFSISFLFSIRSV